MLKGYLRMNYKAIQDIIKMLSDMHEMVNIGYICGLINGSVIVINIFTGRNISYYDDIQRKGK